MSEVSIVRVGRFPGAEITHRMPMPVPPEPRPAPPAAFPPKPAAPERTPTRGQPVEVTHGNGTIIRRTGQVLRVR